MNDYLGNIDYRLSAEEELKLVTKFRESGDLESARKLVVANLHIVPRIAMEYKPSKDNFMEFVQEGNIGLMKAVSKYDPSKGAKLSYYASWWVRSYILKYILDNFRIVKLGSTHSKKKLFYNLLREKQKIESQGIKWDPKIVSKSLNVSEHDVIEMHHRLSPDGRELSLHSFIYDNEDGDFQDMLVDQSESAETVLCNKQLISLLDTKLKTFTNELNSKELLVFKQRLLAEVPKTLQEVSNTWGMTRERARQIELKVIEKLKQHMKEYL